VTGRGQTAATNSIAYRPVYAWYVVFILMLAFIVSFVDRQVITLLVQPIRRDLQISDTEISLLMGFAFAIFYVLMGVPIARLSDSRSRKVIISVGILLWSIATAACGLARNFVQLFVARIFVGVGEATLTPAAYSMIADSFPPHKLGRAIALYSTGIFLGAGLAGVIGGWAVQLLSQAEMVELPIIGSLRPWQMTFLVVSIPGVFLVGIIMATIREPVRRSLRASVDQGAVPIADVIAFMMQNKGTFGAIFIGYAFGGIAFYGFLSWIPEFIRRTHGWEIGDAGMLFGALLAIFGTVGTLTGGWICDWLTQRGYKDAALRGAATFFAIAMPIMVATPLMPSMSMTVPMLALMSFSIALQQAMSPVAIQLVTPNEMRAQVTAVFFVAASFPSIALGATSVALLTDFYFEDDAALRYSLAIVGSIAMSIAAICLAAGMRSYRKSLERSMQWRDE